MHGDETIHVCFVIPPYRLVQSLVRACFRTDPRMMIVPVVVKVEEQEGGKKKNDDVPSVAEWEVVSQ